MGSDFELALKLHGPGYTNPRPTPTAGHPMADNPGQGAVRPCVL